MNYDIKAKHTIEGIERNPAKLDQKATMNANGTVVYAISGIPEGQVIIEDALEQRTILQCKIPPDSITLSSVAVGKKARYGVGIGQILNACDLDPYPRGYRFMPTKNGRLVPQKLQ